MHISFIIHKCRGKGCSIHVKVLVNALSIFIQFSCYCVCLEASRLTEIQQNGLPSEEEAVGDPASQTTPMAPPTSSGGAAQPELPLQGETDGPSTESEAYSMETQEPETGKGRKLSPHHLLYCCLLHYMSYDRYMYVSTR